MGQGPQAAACRARAGPNLGPLGPASFNVFSMFWSVATRDQHGNTREQPGEIRTLVRTLEKCGPRNSGENMKTFGNHGIPRTSKEIRTKIINSDKRWKIHKKSGSNNPGKSGMFGQKMTQASSQGIDMLSIVSTFISKQLQAWVLLSHPTVEAPRCLPRNPRARLWGNVRSKLETRKL